MAAIRLNQGLRWKTAKHRSFYDLEHQASNDAPIAYDTRVNTQEGTEVTFELNALGVDGTLQNMNWSRPKAAK